MDYAIRQFAIQRRKAQIELCRVTCGALEREFRTGTATPAEKSNLLVRWNDVMRDREDAESILDWLERGAQEAGDSTASTGSEAVAQERRQGSGNAAAVCSAT